MSPDETLTEFVLRQELAVVRAEVERLKRGDWTPEENHDICHNLHGKVNAQEFADGCAAEQRKLYGCAPHIDELEKINALAREFGYGQGELDGDLAGCLRKSMDAANAKVRRLENNARTALTEFGHVHDEIVDPVFSLCVLATAANACGAAILIAVRRVLVMWHCAQPLDETLVALSDEVGTMDRADATGSAILARLKTADELERLLLRYSAAKGCLYCGFSQHNQGCELSAALAAYSATKEKPIALTQNKIQ